MSIAHGRPEPTFRDGQRFTMLGKVIGHPIIEKGTIFRNTRHGLHIAFGAGQVLPSLRLIRNDNIALLSFWSRPEDGLWDQFPVGSEVEVTFGHYSQPGERFFATVKPILFLEIEPSGRSGCPTLPVE